MLSDIGYVPQKPWVMSGTVEANICMGRKLDDTRLDHVCATSALETDLANMADGRDSFVGGAR